MLALAGALRARGHAVSFLGLPGIAPLVQAQGFAAVPVDGVQPSLAELEAHLARLRGLRGIGTVIGDVATMTDLLCRVGPSALRDLQAHGVVFDQLEPAGGLLARHLGLPCVSVANALMIDREPYVPPPFTAWPYARTRWARERNLGGYRVSDWMMRRVGAVLARWSAAFGLPERRRAEQCVAPCQVGQMSPLLDFPREALGAGFRYTGPLRRALADEAPWQAPGRGPTLAFVSLGSLQGGRHALLARICRACRELGLTPVVAHHGRLDARQAAALPGAPVVADVLPQRRVIAQCAVVVSHGGLNTVLDALCAGVPLVLVPLAMEQGAIAQRVQRAGAGLPVRGPLPSVRALRGAIGHLLAREDCRDAARRIGRSLQAGGGASAAAALIEGHVAA